MPNYMTPKVPETCLICGAGILGGHAEPGQRMKIGYRVFYKCGASLSVKQETQELFDNNFDSCIMLIKNCGCPENVAVENSQYKSFFTL